MEKERQGESVFRAFATIPGALREDAAAPVFKFPSNMTFRWGEEGGREVAGRRKGGERESEKGGRAGFDRS